MQLKENKKLRKTSKDIEDQQNTKIQELSKKLNTVEVSVATLGCMNHSNCDSQSSTCKRNTLQAELLSHCLQLVLPQDSDM